MYGRNDLRATLATADKKPSATSFHGASYVPFADTPPHEEGPGVKTWYARGRTMVVMFSIAEPGAVFTRTGQVDEYAVCLPDPGTEVSLSLDGGEAQTMTGRAVAFVPAGDSRVEVIKGGRVLQMFTVKSADLIAKAPNAADFADEDPNIPPYQAWPDPIGGRKIRIYSGEVPNEQGRFGRIYRGSNIMVNFGDGRPGKRASTNLSPHHHDDFEQYSVALDGDYVHHLRWPWISDATQWREDEHVHLKAPHVAVIPPPSTHTSQGMDEGLNRLLDVFCPPRMDFSSKPGWVLNADEYPMPQEAAETAEA